MHQSKRASRESEREKIIFFVHAVALYIYILYVCELFTNRNLRRSSASEGFVIQIISIYILVAG